MLELTILEIGLIAVMIGAMVTQGKVPYFWRIDEGRSIREYRKARLVLGKSVEGGMKTKK